MRFGIIVFPGTWSDHDCSIAIGDVLGQDVGYIWHNDQDISRYDCVILPGGFSYGDYLRAGAIAQFSPVMDSVRAHAHDGGLVLGICNGFQILCEAGLLPGALLKNDSLEFRCQWTHLRVENTSTPFTSICKEDQIIRIPISHGEGRYYAEPEQIKNLESENRIIFRYCDSLGAISKESNPNGSLNNIAGVLNQGRNVLGMMPHPERACEPLLGSVDGAYLFQSLIDSHSKTNN